MTMWVDRLIKPSPTREAPGPREQLRNDIAVTVTVLFALFLALGIRNQVHSASKLATLNDGDLRIAYPERWAARSDDSASFTAVHRGSPSTYDSRVEVTSRPLNPDETLELARFDRGLKLATELGGYRELEAAPMQVLNGVFLPSSPPTASSPTRRATPGQLGCPSSSRRRTSCLCRTACSTWSRCAPTPAIGPPTRATSPSSRTACG
jgi:hypothetical protein